MRRPCDAKSASSASAANREEGRLSRMKRMLADSLLLGRRPTASPVPLGTKLFGARLQDVATSPEGVPVILVRLCTFLENHGLQREDLFVASSGNPKLAERLRASLEKRWDAMDLESSGDVCTAALLLTTWLKQLPEPILCNYVATEVLSTHEKMRDEDPATWRESVSAALCTLPDVNIRLLQYLLRFLHRYCVYQQQSVAASASPRSAMLTQLGGVFAPLILLKGPEHSSAERIAQANHCTARLIQDQTALFHQWLIDNSLSSGRQRSSISKKRNTPVPLMCVLPANEPSSTLQRKRKERNESSGSNQSLERKVIRSSSEERRVERAKSTAKNDNIRRVSSHEDFLSSKQGSANTQPVLPLHESNHVELRRKSSVQKDEPQRDCRLDGDTRQLLDESEHEQRRSTERFSRALIPPRSLGRRNVNRKKKLGETSSRNNSEGDGNTSSKENDDGCEEAVLRNKPQATAVQVAGSSEPPHSEPAVACRAHVEEALAEPTHTFLQLHTTERERSPSPSVSPCTPPLDLSTLHQNVDGSEPIASRAIWSYAQSQQQEDNERDPMLSPRNSMLVPHRTFLDHNVPPSPPREHAPTLPGASRELENYVGRLKKQVVSLKKRLKRYEEAFERDCGYRPSLSDKMTNKDTKRLCIELSKLRKEIKQIKEDPMLVGESSSLFDRQLTSGGFLHSSLEETLNEVERLLQDKRRNAGRPEALEDMTVTQQAAEKIAIQKCLLRLEQLHGRAQSKEDREMVRPLYDRYRAVKRVVARASSSKLKESVNELETIHEHEAMDFSPATVAATGAPIGAPGTDNRKEESDSVDSSLQSDDRSNSNSCVSDLEKTAESKPSTSTSAGSLCAQSSVEDASDSQTSSSDSMGENLHALPLSDLILQLIQTREEKLKLKQQRRTLEEQITQRTGRRPSKEERISPNSEYASVYTSYKQTKAKLRLLDALVAKHRKLQRME